MSELPPVWQADVEWSTVFELLADLEALAVEVVVQAKTGMAGFSSEALDLQQAVARLRSGTPPALQLRYTLDGERWCDTILPMPSGALKSQLHHVGLRRVLL